MFIWLAIESRMNGNTPSLRNRNCIPLLIWKSIIRACVLLLLRYMKPLKHLPYFRNAKSSLVSFEDYVCKLYWLTQKETCTRKVTVILKQLFVFRSLELFFYYSKMIFNGYIKFEQAFKFFLSSGMNICRPRAWKS